MGRFSRGAGCLERFRSVCCGIEAVRAVFAHANPRGLPTSRDSILPAARLTMRGVKLAARYTTASTALVLLILGGLVTEAAAEPLTIYELQYTDDPYGGSKYEGQIVDCAGGIVVGKFHGTRPRVILQDPQYPNEWGGIQVKDWTTGGLFDNVTVGDWIELSNVKVEEYRGGTFLQWQTPYSPSFTMISRDNPVPIPLAVSISEIPAPIEYPYDEWFVDNHDAEKYESMRLIVRDVTVTRRDLGKAVDNYNLQDLDENDCWAADYMNEDVAPTGYHPLVTSERHFCAMVGVFEQYTSELDGWDYYQLITATTDDLAVCGDGDHNGQVDLLDFPRLHECLTGPLCNNEPGGCRFPAWMQGPAGLPFGRCLMMDMDYDGDVDLVDIGRFQMVFGGE